MSYDTGIAITVTLTVSVGNCKTKCK